MRPRWPSGKVSSFGRRIRGSKPDSTEDPSCMEPVKSNAVAKRPLAGAVWKLGEGGGMSAQVSPSSSDRGSKLRGRPKNSPRVASKRDVKITKLN
ncbi:hypothetical protein AVEN_55784-1 [Araneus ventricosus]|uniref:Uncharacterized protein n=1 Tax=Araneus ventricosus TaxID=182803 RepID=A0A4Y2EW54_ARAVE|nr:hypothetical protein AVEN_55784-1 [Araneus ventricosus]